VTLLPISEMALAKHIPSELSRMRGHCSFSEGPENLRLLICSRTCWGINTMLPSFKAIGLKIQEAFATCSLGVHLPFSRALQFQGSRV
jgi:hypothetical protein